MRAGGSKPLGAVAVEKQQRMEISPSVVAFTPQSGLEPETYRLTAGCSAIELLRNNARAFSGSGCKLYTGLRIVKRARESWFCVFLPPRAPDNAVLHSRLPNLESMALGRAR